MLFSLLVYIYIPRSITLPRSRCACGVIKQRQVSMFLILLFKLLTQFPFVSFLSISILSLLPFLNPLSSPSPPSLLSLLSILCPPKIKTSIYYILFTFAFCFTPWHLIMHSINLKKTNFDAWAPTCHTLRTWRNNGSLSHPLSSLFSHFP